MRNFRACIFPRLVLQYTSTARKPSGRLSQAVRQGSAKPSFVGPIPTDASKGRTRQRDLPGLFCARKQMSSRSRKNFGVLLFPCIHAENRAFPPGFPRVRGILLWKRIFGAAKQGKTGLTAFAIQKAARFVTGAFPGRLIRSRCTDGGVLL